MEDLMEMDLYALIGTAPGASVKEVTTVAKNVKKNKK